MLHTLVTVNLIVSCRFGSIQSTLYLVWLACRAVPSRPGMASEVGVAERGSPLVRPDAEWDKMKALLKQRDDEISIHTICCLGVTTPPPTV